MATFIKGDVVVMPFPFSDLSDSKRRPALVLSDSQGDDVILCQITSKNTRDNSTIPLENSDLMIAEMQVSSNIRSHRLIEN